MYGLRTLDGQHPSEIIRNEGEGNSRARGQSKEFTVTVAFQEAIEFFQETGLALRVSLGDMLQVAAQEDQAAGAAFALGGGDPGLGASDLFLQVGALAALGMLQLFFLGLQLLLQGLLPGQKLIEFFLWVHSGR